MTGSSGQPPADVTAVTGPDPDISDSLTIRITAPEGLIGLVPYLLGFHPGQDIVIIGTRAPGHIVEIALRYPLDPAAVTDQVHHALAVLAMQNYDTAMAVGYGPDGLVTPFMDWLRPHANQHSIRFTELLRVDTGQQRYWSYLCADPDCCPPEGRPYDSRPDSAPTGSLPADVPAVLDSRKALVELAGPVVGEEAAMIRATRHAEQRLADIAGQAARTGRQAAGRRAIALADIEATKHAIQTYRQGGCYTHDEAARLSVCLEFYPAIHRIQQHDASQPTRPLAAREYRYPHEILRKTLVLPSFSGSPQSSAQTVIRKTILATYLSYKRIVSIGSTRLGSIIIHGRLDAIDAAMYDSQRDASHQYIHRCT